MVPDPRGQQLTFLTARGYHKVITTTALVFIDTQNWGKGQRDPSETAGPRKEMVCHSIKIYYLHQAACNRDVQLTSRALPVRASVNRLLYEEWQESYLRR